MAAAAADGGGVGGGAPLFPDAAAAVLLGAFGARLVDANERYRRGPSASPADAVVVVAVGFVSDDNNNKLVGAWAPSRCPSIVAKGPRDAI